FAAPTTSLDAGTKTAIYSLTVNPVPEGSVVGGATAATVNVCAPSLHDALPIFFDSDDTLGNVTIICLPGDLSNFNGGTYTAGTGTWTGTAAQFNALSFTSGEQGAYTLSISAATTGAEAGTTTASYTLTVNPVSE